MKILVLGAGRMGLGAAYDLAHSADVEAVTLADLDIERARAVVETIKSDKLTPAHIDVTNSPQVIELMRGHDAAISCVVYHHNLRLARAAIEARTNFCDLGGNNGVVADELALDEDARRASVNIIPDCGLAPGMVSVLVAHGAARFERLDEIHIRVGGLPQQPKPPLNYQLIFSIEGLINEYVERARVIRKGRIIEVDSLTEVERLEFPQPFGAMEAFQTSGGTSTLPESFLGQVQELDYKTIRYPGHCEQFRLLVDLGLASSEEVEIDGVRATPRKILGEMLMRNLPADEPDAVLIRVEFRGVSEGAERELRYDIIDRFDESTGLSAMMRTTAFPASIIAQMIARGETKQKGAVLQELCIPLDEFVAALAKRNIKIRKS
ncbi:MAG: saccharopine dehydrogenase [Acidobacteria bacterium]|nr:MAG: saccharopine dehydrogenase [Acidobacteriota bacterium]